MTRERPALFRTWMGILLLLACGLILTTSAVQLGAVGRLSMSRPRLLTECAALLAQTVAVTFLLRRKTAP